MLDFSVDEMAPMAYRMPAYIATHESGLFQTLDHNQIHEPIMTALLIQVTVSYTISIAIYALDLI